MSNRFIRIPLVSLALALACWTAAEAKSGWVPAGNLIAPVGPNNAFALTDGRVVSVGMVQDEDGWSATTQKWNPATNKWKAAAATPTLPNLYEGVAVMLDDGRILVTGYCASDCTDGANAELYDPAHDRWTMPGQMKHGRYDHAAVRLADGRVLVMGGCLMHNCMAIASSAEIFDPATGQFTDAAPMRIHRARFTATLLGDGRILVAGGFNINGVLAENETYDPVSNSWHVNTPMTFPHRDQAAALLHDERVLIAGGDCGDGRPCDKAETFDPLTGRWKKTGPMGDPRQYAAAITLQDGRVLIAGGLSAWGNLWRYLETAKLFDPSTDTFVHAKMMSAQRGNFSMTMLPDGRVMAVGGDAWIDEFAGTAEIYTP